MSKVLVNESSLTGIANAIRGKNGSTDTYKPSEMAAAITAISGGGGGSGADIPDEVFMISGYCNYWDYNGSWDNVITAFADRWNTNDIVNAQFMFNGCKLAQIPFNINFNINSNTVSTQGMFQNAYYITQIPQLNNLKVYSTSSLFYNCWNLRTISSQIANNWDWSNMQKSTSSYSYSQSNMFYGCFSLRSVPINLIKFGNPSGDTSVAYFYGGFNSCFVLDELINLPIPYVQAKWQQNGFVSTFASCYRLKNVTFARQDDGTPYIASWKNQTIYLSTVGYVGSTYEVGTILNYNSGITADKQVTDDATYQALKDDPDWWTTDVAYSRYNHDSAVATINSLPDTSAYLAANGGTNTIKFKGAAGSATDGGAINTLTEEEIAVATAKGWSVSLV